MKKVIGICIFLFVGVFTLNAQNRTLSGKVTDMGTGEPIVGASVLQNGTTNGVITDVDGRYTINLPYKAVGIIYSAVGYTPQFHAISQGARTWNVKLEESGIDLKKKYAIGVMQMGGIGGMQMGNIDLICEKYTTDIYSGWGREIYEGAGSCMYQGMGMPMYVGSGAQVCTEKSVCMPMEVSSAE